MIVTSQELVQWRNEVSHELEVCGRYGTDSQGKWNKKITYNWYNAYWKVYNHGEVVIDTLFADVAANAFSSILGVSE